MRLFNCDSVTLLVSYIYDYLNKNHFFMKTFEYKILSNKVFRKSELTEENFNRLGKQGWQLISVSTLESGVAKAFFIKES